MPDEKLGVDQTVEFIDQLAQLILDVKKAEKDHKWSDILVLLGKLKELIDKGRDALPELESISKEEAVKLTEAAYDAFKKITGKEPEAPQQP